LEIGNLNASLETVPLARIDFENRRYALDCREPSAALVDSIRRQGLLSPPLLSQPDRAGLHTIALGRKRLLACRAAGLDAADCLVASPETAELDLLSAAIEYRRAKGGLGKIEKGRAFRAWESLCPAGDPESAFLPLIGLAPKRGILDPIRKWARIPADVELAYFEGLLPEASALALARWDERARAAFANLFREFHFGINLQKEALELVPETARRENSGIAEAIGSLRAEAANLVPPESSTPDQAEAFRRCLLRRRFPRLSKAEERFAGAVKELRLPKGCAVVPPPSFEGDVYRFTCAFASIEQAVKNLTDSARRIGASEGLREFLERGE
jgi:ParB family chromosome partitioning protein